MTQQAHDALQEQIQSLNDAILRAMTGIDLDRDNFYKKRVASRNLLFGSERPTIAYVLQEVDESTPLIEVGGGFCQLSIALAALGRTVTVFEQSHERSSHVAGIIAQVEQQYPGTLQRLTLREEQYPPNPHVSPEALVLLMNVVNSYWLNFVAKHGATAALHNRCTILTARAWDRSRLPAETKELWQDFVKNGCAIQEIDQQFCLWCIEPPQFICAG
jgi:hypothetical protein